MNKAEMIQAAIKATPHGFAKVHSGGIWNDWAYLRLISREIAKAIAKGGGRIIVNMPPQHGKSLFISKWVPLWYLSNYPSKRIILATYEASFAASWGRAVRDEAEETPEMGIKVRRDVKASNFWQTIDGGGMMTAGVGGPVTGKSGDLLIIDDPVKNWDEARSVTYQQRNIDWFNSTLYTRKQPGTTIIVLMTRWHENDLAGYLLNNHSDDWKLIRLPAISEAGDVLREKEGIALCPQRFDEEELEKTKRAVGSQVWAGLYQQRPTALEGGIVKREWLKYYDHAATTYDEMIQSWDLSFKKTDDGSFVVGQVWGRTNSDFFLVDQIRKRMNFPETKSAIRNMSLKYPDAHKKIIEDKANGPAIIDDLKSQIPGLTPYKDNSSKESRLSAVSAYFESGNVYIPNPKYHEWVQDFIEELVNFPNAANDDQVDACSQAIKNLNKRRFELPQFTPGIGEQQMMEVF